MKAGVKPYSPGSDLSSKPRFFPPNRLSYCKTS